MCFNGFGTSINLYGKDEVLTVDRHCFLTTRKNKAQQYCVKHVLTESKGPQKSCRIRVVIAGGPFAAK